MIGESALIWKGGVQMPKTTVNITGVSLCQKKGIIRIFRSTIKELGDPRYIRFLFNPEKRTLAVQSAEKKRSVFVCLNIILKTGILKFAVFKC